MIFRVSLLLFVCWLAACSGHEPDARLSAIEKMADEAPEAALDSLRGIDSGSLPEADRHYYDFLMVKVSDKAYVSHTGDSLVLSVINYESRHDENGRFPEALYYGGRVYSDLGDYPTALNYFHDALDNLPEDNNERNLDLKSRILSQTSSLLDRLRLYGEAIPVLEESISITRESHDTVGLVYNLQQLGGTFTVCERYASADSCLRMALYEGRNLPPSFESLTKVYMASLKYLSGQNDSALNYIRGVPESVKSVSRLGALARAARIYLDANITDTAFMYIKELMECEDIAFRRTGFQLFLSSSLTDSVPVSHLKDVVEEYRDILDEYYDENSVQQVNMQQTAYNYRVHEREREKAELENATLWLWIAGISILALGMLHLMLYQKYKNKTNILKLRNALEMVQELKSQLASHPLQSDEEDAPEVTRITKSKIPDNVDLLREQLRKEIKELCDADASSYTVPSVIIESEAYCKLQEYIGKGKMVTDNCILWKELEAVVLECSPKFVEKLKLLTGGNLSANDLRTALLVKCGVSPINMHIVLGISKGGVGSRRETLCRKVFGEKLGVRTIDAVIRSL